LAGSLSVVYSYFRVSFYFWNAVGTRQEAHMSTTVESAAVEPPGDRRLGPILFVLALTEINSAFEVGMVYGVIGALMREFGPSATGWVVTSFLLMGAIAAALGSRLGDIFGRKRVVLVMLVLAMTGSVINATSDTLTGLIVGRSIQGVAGALLPLCIGLVREYFPAPRVPKAIGWLAAIASFSAMMGIVVGGYLADTVGWRTTFWLAAAHALVSIACVVAVLPASRAFGLRTRFDWLGGILFAPAIAALLLGLEFWKKAGLGDTRFLAFTATGAVLLAAWIARELRHPEPMIDVRELATRQLGLTMLLMLLFGLGSSQLMLMLLLIAQQPVWTGIGLGLSATVAAWLKIPSGLSGLIGSPWSGHVAARHGARRAAILGSLVVSAGWMAFAFLHDSALQLVLVSALCTIGGAVLYAAIPNLVVEVAPVERTAELNGMSHVFRTVGTAIGTQVVTLLLATSMAVGPDGTASKHPAAEAFMLAFLAINAMALVSVLVALALPRRRHPQPHAAAEAAATA
jgi:MFS family permease